MMQKPDFVPKPIPVKPRKSQARMLFEGILLLIGCGVVVTGGLWLLFYKLLPWLGW